MRLVFDSEDTSIPEGIQKRWESEDFTIVEWSKSIPIVTKQMSHNSNEYVKEVNKDGHISLDLRLSYRKTVGEIQDIEEKNEIPS